MPVIEVKCHLHGDKGREVTRVVGEEEGAVVALAARHLPTSYKSKCFCDVI